MHQFKKPLALAIFMSGMAAGVAQAQTAPVPSATPAAPAPTTEKAAEPPAREPIFSIGGFDLTGHFDVGYSRLKGYGKFVSGVNDRVFDFDRNKGSFHALDLQLARTPENGFGAVVDLTIGKDADTIAAYGSIDKNRGPANGVDRRFDVTQAYVHFGAAPLTIIAGKYVTSAGAEVIKSDSDTNYSRSILFGYAIPFTHTGVRATYKISDELTVLGGINQGWDAVQDTNSDKTLELGGTLTLSKAFSLAGSLYTGKERVTNYPKSDANGTRNLVDLVATFNVNDQLTLIGNYDYGTQEGGSASGGKAKWTGIAAYLNYQFNDQWKMSLRGEYFDDKDGYRTGIAQTWKEATLTFAYLPTKALEIRAEVRADRSDKQAFLKSDGFTPTNSERSFGVEVLYKF